VAFENVEPTVLMDPGLGWSAIAAIVAARHAWFLWGRRVRLERQVG
jgi:hypothetical protein